MKKINELTVNDILEYDYNTLISIVEETNRAPGGYATVQAVANLCCLNKDSIVLEIGTSTGNTAIELARLCKCQIQSIDINERSVQKTSQRIGEEGLAEYVQVSVMDATALDFPDETFDVVFCGNVTSLIPNKEKAFSEYRRVLKNGGLLVAVPMYYCDIPTVHLLERVSDSIRLPIAAQYEQDWLNFYKEQSMVIKFREKYRFHKISDKDLKNFIEFILEKPHLRQMQPDALECLKKRYKEFLFLYRENLSHMGYSILVYSKELFNNEPEFFTAFQVLDNV